MSVLNGFWQWYITFRISRFLDFVHCLILQKRTLCSGNWVCSLSSGERLGRHLLYWVWQKGLLRIAHSSSLLTFIPFHLRMRTDTRPTHCVIFRCICINHEKHVSALSRLSVHPCICLHVSSWQIATNLVLEHSVDICWETPSLLKYRMYKNCGDTHFFLQSFWIHAPGIIMLIKSRMMR
jgi:hypothetical protein